MADPLMPRSRSTNRLNRREYFPIMWQQLVPLSGAAWASGARRVRTRRQELDPDGDPTILGEVILRGIKESA